jgi:hypothetical protein
VRGDASVVCVFTEATMITLANWAERMSEDMRLRDFRPKTQDAYRRAVRQFLTHVQKEPAALCEADVRQYLIYLRDERMLAGSTRNIVVHGLRFFFRIHFRKVGPYSISFGSQSRRSCRPS